MMIKRFGYAPISTATAALLYALRSNPEAGAAELYPEPKTDGAKRRQKRFELALTAGLIEVTGYRDRGGGGTERSFKVTPTGLRALLAHEAAIKSWSKAG